MRPSEGEARGAIFLPRTGTFQSVFLRKETDGMKMVEGIAGKEELALHYLRCFGMSEGIDLESPFFLTRPNLVMNIILLSGSSISIEVKTAAINALIHREHCRQTLENFRKLRDLEFRELTTWEFNMLRALERRLEELTPGHASGIL